MESELQDVSAHYASVAAALDLDSAEIARPIHTSMQVKEAFGEGSLHYVTWKLLSDLSHYSYTLTRQFSKRSEFVGETNSIVTLGVFVTHVNSAMELALELVRQALTVPDEG